MDWRFVETELNLSLYQTVRNLFAQAYPLPTIEPLLSHTMPDGVSIDLLFRAINRLRDMYKSNHEVKCYKN